MSRTHMTDQITRDGFPRVSGDEPPIGLIVVAIGAFSPRERG